jgi:hypothetical protein
MEAKAKTALGAVLSGQANPHILDSWERQTGKAITKALVHMHMSLSLVRTAIICYAGYHLVTYDDLRTAWSFALVSIAVGLYQLLLLGFDDFNGATKIAAKALEIEPGELLAMDTELARERAAQRLRYLDHECYRAERRKDLDVGFWPDLEYLSALRRHEEAEGAFVKLGLADPEISLEEGEYR